MGYGDSEKQVYLLYKMSNKVDEFYSKKPKLTEEQLSLLSAFYKLSQERRTEQGFPLVIRDSDIRAYQRYNSSIYASDLFIHAINELDREYIDIKAKEIQRKAK